MALLRYLLILFFIPSFAYAQHEITGTIYSDDSGETLPSATVIIENTLKGTITNNEGQFSISVDEFPVILRISYIGFETQTVRVQHQSDSPLSIRLKPSVTELEAIVVTDRDPGLSIMEKVIERKKIWRKDLETYQSTAYTRQVLENDTSIVSIVESESISYWDHEKGHREIQISAQQTSNISADQNFAGVSYLPNFYDDNITIAGYNMVGITHPDALKYYNFSLKETLQMDGLAVYKIEVTPKRQRQPTFLGTAYVLDREYALIEVNLKPNDVVNFPPPVQEFDLSYKQQFNNFGSDFWLPIDMRVDGIIRIGMVGLRFPSMKFRQLSRLTDYRVNIAIPDSVFREREIISRAETGTVQPELSTTSNPDSVDISGKRSFENSIPLTAEEQNAYASIDSTQTLEEAFKPEGFLARRLDDSESGGNNFLGSAGRFLPGGFGLNGRFNRADGFHLGGKYQNRFKAGFEFKTFAGYSFNSENWDYGINFRQQLFDLDRNRISILSGYENSTVMQQSSNLYSTGLQSFSALLGGGDYSDYYRNEHIYGELEIRNVLPRFHVQLSVNHENHRSFEPDNELDYSLFGWHDTPRENPQINDGNLRSVATTISYGDFNRSSNFGFAGSRNISLSAELSEPGFGSDFDFLNLSMKLDWNFPTFYQRRLFANSLDLHFSGGYSFGELPLQRFGAIDGSLRRFTPFGSLKTRKYLPYRGNKYWLATAEHNFRTIPFELIRLDALVDRGWGLILFGGAGYSEADGDFLPNSVLTNGVHSEIGVSLNSIFGVLRIDFAKRLDSSGSFIGFSVPRYF